MVVAAIKAVSLAYLLGLIALSIASLYWWAAGRTLAPRNKAAVAFGLLTSSGLLSLIAAWYILWGVTSHRILMTTNYFHRLMYGGWAAAIDLGGLFVLLVSLFLAVISWRRSRVPRVGAAIDRVGSVPIKAAAMPDTASLVGVFRPEIWVNTEYWGSLDKEARQAALTHELEHLGRRDNLKKLVLQFITTLYFAVPWIREWSARFDLYTELAVDDVCQEKLGQPAYLSLIGGAASFLLAGSRAAVSSQLGQSDIVERLRVLNSQRQPGGAFKSAAIGVSGAAVSLVPTVALLLHPIPRCFLACYLGY